MIIEMRFAINGDGLTRNQRRADAIGADHIFVPDGTARQAFNFNFFALDGICEAFENHPNGAAQQQDITDILCDVADALDDALRVVNDFFQRLANFMHRARAGHGRAMA